MELSAACGLSLLHVLTGDYGIDESRLTFSSHGALSPEGVEWYRPMVARKTGGAGY